MFTYRRFTVSILLLVALVAVAKATAVDNDVDPRLKKICNTIDHLKKDFRRYFSLYKKLAKRFNESKKLKGNNKCRDELNRMFAILKKLLELIRRMEEIKDKIKFGTQEVISILDGWIIEILNMVADLAEIAEKILKCEKKSNRMQTFIAEFRTLNQDCLDVAQDNLIEVLAGEVTASLQQSSPSLRVVWKPPVPDFWAKILELRRLCQELIKCFISTRNLILKLGFKESYPYREMQRMCGCLIQFCRMSWKLMMIRMNAPQMSPHQLEKALCEWLMELMEIRVKLMDYYNDLLAAAKKLANEKPDEGLKLFEFIENCFGSILMKLDDCLLKMQCWYIDMVLAGGPMRIGIVAQPVGPADTSK